MQQLKQKPGPVSSAPLPGITPRLWPRDEIISHVEINEISWRRLGPRGPTRAMQPSRKLISYMFN
jgi:hypothetical protein